MNLQSLLATQQKLAASIEAAGASPVLTDCIVLCGEIGDAIRAEISAQCTAPTEPPPIAVPVPACADWEPRPIVDHKLNGLNEAINLVALDQPGPGGANHRYAFCLYGAGRGTPATMTLVVDFQNGPILEAELNGFSNEGFLAMVIDRMRGFQYGRKPDGTYDENVRGKFACRDNAIVLTLLEDALMRLQKRTRDRLTRGVEGRNIA